MRETSASIQNKLTDLQDARESLWKLYLADHISKATWTRGTREVKAKIDAITGER